MRIQFGLLALVFAGFVSADEEFEARSYLPQYQAGNPLTDNATAWGNVKLDYNAQLSCSGCVRAGYDYCYNYTLDATTNRIVDKSSTCNQAKSVPAFYNYTVA